jgi:hypothetical protein
VTHARDEEVRAIAQRLAAEAGNPSGRDLDFWLQAERLHDERAIEAGFSPRQIYANFMQRFYAGFDHRTPVKADADFGYTKADDLGHRFLHSVAESQALLKALQQSKNQRDLFDVSILTDKTDFEDMAKRSLLMSDTSLLGDQAEASIPFYRRDDYVEDAYGACQHTDFYGNIDPANLTLWLEALRPNLVKGDLFFLPHTRTDHQMQMFGGRGVEDHRIFEAVVRAGRVKSFATEQVAKQKFITFLAEVPLPTVNEVPLATFATAYNDNIAAANHLKEALRERFFELESAKVSELAETSMKKIGNRIAREARVAVSDLKAVTRRSAVQTAGVALGTGIAILAAINVQAFAAMAPLISGAGGLAAVYKAIDGFLESKAKRAANPYLFIWLLSRSSDGA